MKLYDPIKKLIDKVTSRSKKEVEPETTPDKRRQLKVIERVIKKIDLQLARDILGGLSLVLLMSVFLIGNFYFCISFISFKNKVNDKLGAYKFLTTNYVKKGTVNNCELAKKALLSKDLLEAERNLKLCLRKKKDLSLWKDLVLVLILEGKCKEAKELLKKHHIPLDDEVVYRCLGEVRK